MATLDTYRRKRNFRSTAEPKGRKAKRGGTAFVVQKHAARRLHYDLRLEMGGVLKSWAVTKGPSLVPGEKRLAVEVEDHPLEYGEFEGTIPKGQYGGGSVIVWDKGTWTPVGDAEKGYRKGHIEFELDGEKLTGRWHLVRMQKRPEEKRDNWLLIKADDEAGRSADQPDILDERPESVKTERRLEEISDDASRRTKSPSGARKRTPIARSLKKISDASSLAGKKGAKKAAMPPFIAPALATLMRAPPTGSRWVHEIKFDGYRVQAQLKNGRVKLLTRSGLDWSGRFGRKIVTALAELPAESALIDGEIVVEAGAGASDFSALQADLSAGRSDRFVFYVFDALYLDGYDIRDLPLIERKERLARVVETAPDVVRLSDHFEEEGPLVLRHACRLSLEGVISKQKHAPYRSGRTKAWVKSKCSDRQEFVVVGYAPSTTSQKAIGSLIMGVYEKDALVHVGRVGTGFTHKVAEDLFERLQPLRISKRPFAKPLTAEQARNVRYVDPQLVAEVEFRAWTADGHLRHASFRGIREDKPAREIVREAPWDKGVREAPWGKDVREAPSATGVSKASPGKSAGIAKAQKRRVKLTHPDRVYWPDNGVTKEGLADYYTEVWRWIAPHIVGRALALLRCPTGIGGQQFFQKHAWKGLNSNIVPVKDPKDRAGEPLISIRDIDGLMGLVQSAALEIHPWGSMVSDWERPDRIVMDLDPGEGVAWEEIVTAAEETRRRLEDVGLNPFVKTSGGKGLHVVAPLTAEANWMEVKAFTKSLAEEMAADSPDTYVATVSKAKRKGRILVDYLRNQRGMTAVAPYSTRARPGAPVSMPVHWDELGAAIGPAYFTLENAPTRLAALKADPWAEFQKAAVPLRVTRRRASKR
ncbi:DNA ligase D [Hyphomicrobium sp.]|uniref:DNA ligase D n=1 Tax=Hyphomicrobium sp. TaxID=82 RepID=UPI002C3202EC|nr:DNA ligase D [Hyphomicrobium sp.]HRN87284.1 DNA ligase D [Hyphomicrobium sp.]HRQ25958.1 DNA ligase D [Hyphomicrobium sp.]